MRKLFRTHIACFFKTRKHSRIVDEQHRVNAAVSQFFCKTGPVFSDRNIENFIFESIADFCFYILQLFFVSAYSYYFCAVLAG